MKSKYSFYDDLNVARNAPTEVIRAAYKALAQKYHPDRNSVDADATKIMAVINAAYETLSDPLKRREYDRCIAEEEAKRSTNSSPQPKTQPIQPKSSEHQASNHSPRYEQYVARKKTPLGWRAVLLVCIFGGGVGAFSGELLVGAFGGAMLGLLLGGLGVAGINGLNRMMGKLDKAPTKKTNKYEWVFTLLVMLGIWGYQKNTPQPTTQVRHETITSNFKQECISTARLKSPNAPAWYPTYYCDCAEKEYSYGHSLEDGAATCSRQLRAILDKKANDCADKIGRREEDKPLIRECLDNS